MQSFVMLIMFIKGIYVCQVLFQTKFFFYFSFQSADNWDGESDLSGFAGGETYPDGGMEESGDSEAQGVSVTLLTF